MFGGYSQNAYLCSVVTDNCGGKGTKKVPKYSEKTEV